MAEKNSLGIRWLSSRQDIGITQDGGFKFYQANADHKYN